MPNVAWLRDHYRYDPPAIRSAMLNPRLRDRIEVVEDLVRRFPREYSVHSRLVQLLHDAGRKKAAIRQWNRNTQLFPDSPSPYFQRARLVMQAGGWLEAARWYTKCLRKDTGYYRTAVRFRRGECYLRAEKWDLARSDFLALPDSHEDFSIDGIRTKSQMLEAAEKGART
jgi:tetratricopeptide (TPR) repeat protein